jgi:hypothetical protein
MKILTLTTLFTALFAFPACQSRPANKEAGKPSITAPVAASANQLGATAESVNTKAENVEVKQAERDGKLVADINAASTANTNNPEGVPKEQVDSHLKVAKGRLAGTPEDPVAKAEAAERDMMFESGRAAEARAATERTVKEAMTQAGELANLKSEFKLEREKLTGEITSLKTKITQLDSVIADNLKANQAAIEAALDKERKASNRKLTWGLTIGTVALLAVGAFLGYGKMQAGEPIKAAIAAGFWGGAAGICAIFAWALNQQWFQEFVKWMIIGSGTLGLAAGAIYIIAELRSAKEKKELVQTAKTLDKDATEADSTLLKFYDSVEEALPPEQLAKVVQTAKEKLNDNEKAYVNELKAIRQRAKAAGAIAA